MSIYDVKIMTIMKIKMIEYFTENRFLLSFSSAFFHPSLSIRLLIETSELSVHYRGKGTKLNSLFIWINISFGSGLRGHL